MLTQEQQQALGEARARLEAIGAHLDRPRLRKLIAELEERSAQPDFWDDPTEANKQQQLLSKYRNTVQPFESLEKTERDIREMYELLKLDHTEELESEIDQMAIKLLRDLDTYELQTLLNGEHDDRNALVEINAGAGGSEACDWASILYRMYTRWAERRGYKIELMSETPGDVVGYRTVAMQISGPQAY